MGKKQFQYKKCLILPQNDNWNINSITKINNPKHKSFGGVSTNITN